MYKLENSGIEVLETEDLPEADQHLCSEKTKPSSDKAEEDPFKNRDEYEFDPSTKTLQHKLQALCLEITQLQQMHQEDATTDTTATTPPPAQALLDDVTALKKILSSQDPMSRGNLTDPQGNVHKKLLASIDKLFPAEGGSTESTPPPSSTPSSTHPLSYHLNFPPSNNLTNVEKMRELEKRVARLDSAIGNLSPLPSVLMLDAYNKSILDAVAFLASKSKVLEGQNWSDVEVKAGAVLKRMDQIREKKDLLDQKAKMDKVSELYSIMLRWNKLTQVLPLISHKLLTLKTLHNHALEFNQCLSHLEVTQQRMCVQLKGHKQLLTQVQTEMAKNVAVIKSRCEAIQQRVNKLNQ